jgi:folate-binding Fe-S cluster repair protein YgfZ
MMNGFCEVIYYIKSEYLKDLIPFSANFDLFNSINFSKGCYQG